jgi:predicted DNA binding protein
LFTSGTSLADLADDLGISKSALSQRHQAVESKLALSAFEGKDG